jgi:hypothetical protein
MTINAKMHIETVNPCHPVHFLNIPVTMAAIYLPVNVYRVVEKHKVRHILYFLPFNWFILSKMQTQMLNFRMVNNYSLMTQHTGLKRRYSRSCCLYGSIVAHKAADSFLSCMNPVTEMDRLLRTCFIPEIIL